MKMLDCLRSLKIFELMASSGLSLITGALFFFRAHDLWCRPDVQSWTRAREVPGKAQRGEELTCGCQRQLRLSGRALQQPPTTCEPLETRRVTLGVRLAKGLGERRSQPKGERSCPTISGSWESIGTRSSPRDRVTCVKASSSRTHSRWPVRS